ncbi:MAG: hypothetical protein DWQ02_04980 [Bacteroidetes bacterium]|nr:MAG: hypothetical protein DWQ02_04980 [Bacteroidota bacterium]
MVNYSFIISCAISKAKNDSKIPLVKKTLKKFSARKPDLNRWFWVYVYFTDVTNFVKLTKNRIFVFKS